MLSPVDWFAIRKSPTSIWMRIKSEKQNLSLIWECHNWFRNLDFATKNWPFEEEEEEEVKIAIEVVFDKNMEIKN